MPIYEYQCNACDERFDKLIRSLNRMPAEIVCPMCKSSSTQRLISAPAVRTGDGAGSDFDMVDSTPATPPVFGRKELKQAEEKKRQLKDQIQYEKKQQAKKKL